MPDPAVLEGYAVEQAGALTASTQGTVITASATINTKGAWAQLIAATTYESSWVMVTMSEHNGAGRYLVDIGIGAAASETVIIPNLHYANNGSGALSTQMYLFPLTIPAGVRIAARCQNSTASRTIRITVTLIAASTSSTSGFGRVTGYGQAPADSGLTAVDPGGTINVKGAWVQLTASTTAETHWLCIGIGHDALAIATLSYNWLLDIGIGGAGSETVIIPNLLLRANSSDDSPEPQVFHLPVNIPNGVRLAARCQCTDITSATERLIDVAVWGCD